MKSMDAPKAHIVGGIILGEKREEKTRVLGLEEENTVEGLDAL